MIKKKKILLIRLSSIGDLILCSPVFRSLHKDGSYELHLLTKEAQKNIVSENPYINKIHFLCPSLKETKQILLTEDFDYIIDLHNSLRSLYLKFCLKRFIHCYTFPKQSIRRMLASAFHAKKFLSKTHVVDRYFSALKKLKIKNDKKGLDFFISKDIRFPILESFPYKDYMVIAVGSKHYTKQIPTEAMWKLCSNIKAPIILAGDKNDRLKADKIIHLWKKNKETSLPPYILNTCGKYNLQETAKIIQNARLVVSGDSALMHMAAALDKNIISVWGSTVPEFGFTPYYAAESKAIHIPFQIKELSCRPCHKHGRAYCPKKHFHCMIQQDYKQMAITINKLIEN